MARFGYSKEESKNLTTPLLTAITLKQTESKEIIADGKFLEKTDHYGDTPLMAAVQMKELEIVKSLLAAGVDVYTSNNEGNTALSFSLSWNGQKSPITKTIMAHINQLEQAPPSPS